MRNRRILLSATAVCGALVLSGLAVVTGQQAQEPPPMGFFITSTGLGDGANLGGLDGADAHCQTLAAAVGGGDRTWRAYLSTQGPGAVNARDRIEGRTVGERGGPRHGHQRRKPALRQLQLQLDPHAGRERQTSSHHASTATRTSRCTTC